VDERRKAVIVVVLAAMTGIGGILAIEAVLGSRPGYKPAASVARVEMPAATAGPSASNRTPATQPAVVPTATPKAKPTAAPPWKANWSKPHLVDKDSCGAFAVGIDPASRYHVIDECGLHYSVSDGTGDWTTTSLGDTKAQGPLIAFDGNRAYIAYWRLLPWEPDTCGGPQQGPSAGVYFRRRTLPDGAWSNAIAFGKKGDHLEAFRVDGGVLHAIVSSDISGRTFYVRASQNPVASARHRIVADGDTALRVGDDGRARVAYWHNGSLLYGTFNGSGFSTSKVSDGPTDNAASLVLGDGNQPHVVYTIVRPTYGCGDGVKQPSRVGTWYATMVNGKWISQRINKKVGFPSLVLDPGSGRVFVLLDNVVYTKAPTGTWESARLPKVVKFPVMRIDPATGSLLLVYEAPNPDGESSSLMAITSQ
jgi:hypothetical protein